MEPIHLDIKIYTNLRELIHRFFKTHIDLKNPRNLLALNIHHTTNRAIDTLDDIIRQFNQAGADISPATEVELWIKMDGAFHVIANILFWAHKTKPALYVTMRKEILSAMHSKLDPENRLQKKFLDALHTQFIGDVDLVQPLDKLHPYNDKFKLNLLGLLAIGDDDHVGTGNVLVDFLFLDANYLIPRLELDATTAQPFADVIPEMIAMIPLLEEQMLKARILSGLNRAYYDLQKQHYTNETSSKPLQTWFEFLNQNGIDAEFLYAFRDPMHPELIIGINYVRNYIDPVKHQERINKEYVQTMRVVLCQEQIRKALGEESAKQFSEILEKFASPQLALSDEVFVSPPVVVPTPSTSVSAATTDTHPGVATLANYPALEGLGIQLDSRLQPHIKVQELWRAVTDFNNGLMKLGAVMAAKILQDPDTQQIISYISDPKYYGLQSVSQERPATKLQQLQRPVASEHIIEIKSILRRLLAKFQTGAASTIGPKPPPP